MTDNGSAIAPRSRHHLPSCLHATAHAQTNEATFIRTMLRWPTPRSTLHSHTTLLSHSRATAFALFVLDENDDRIAVELG